MAMFSRGITRELSVSKCSHEDYHGGASASIPFTWESQPGTPKMKSSEYPLPPLSPPPSYDSNIASKRSVVIRKNSKGNLFQTIFPKRTTRKKSSPSSSPAYSTSSSSSSRSSFASSPRPTSCSVPSSPMAYKRSLATKEKQSPRFSFGSRDHEDEEYDGREHQMSNLMSLRNNTRSSQGCYSFLIKKVLLGD